MSGATLAAERLSGSRSCPERFDVVIAGAGLDSPTVDFAKTSPIRRDGEVRKTLGGDTNGTSRTRRHCDRGGERQRTGDCGLPPAQRVQPRACRHRRRRSCGDPARERGRT